MQQVSTEHVWREMRLLYKLVPSEEDEEGEAAAIGRESKTAADTPLACTTREHRRHRTEPRTRRESRAGGSAQIRGWGVGQGGGRGWDGWMLSQTESSSFSIRYDISTCHTRPAHPSIFGPRPPPSCPPGLNCDLPSLMREEDTPRRRWCVVGGVRAEGARVRGGKEQRQGEQEEEEEEEEE